MNVAWDLKKRGYAENTIQGYVKRLKMLSKRADLRQPEEVKGFIACQPKWSNAYKECCVNAYTHYARLHGYVWERPEYKRDLRVPAVPTTEQVNKIIAHSGRKYAVVFTVLRDTGLRPVELHRLTRDQIDLENGRVYPSTAKSGRPRVLRLKKATVAMLKEYVKRQLGKQSLFPPPTRSTHVFMRVRNRLAQRLHEPELKRIRLYDLRHYFATMLYHKTRDILLVKEKLGHRKIESTLIYTHLIDFRDEEYTVRSAENIKQATQLLESGFEYVITLDGVQLYRKRK